MGYFIFNYWNIEGKKGFSPSTARICQ
jgi:hypothetical protein